MTLQSPTVVKDPEVQQALDEIRRRFPLRAADVAFNSITGDVTISAAGVSAIGNSKITSAMITDGTIVDADVAAANKDGTAATLSLRTLGTGSTQAAAGDKSLNSTVENLKVIRGTFTSTTPTIVSGLGFTLTRNGVGDVTVNFTAAFSTAPTVTFSCTGSGGIPIADVLSTTISAARLRCFQTTTAAQEFTNGQFIAVGPR